MIERDRERKKKVERDRQAERGRERQKGREKQRQRQRQCVFLLSLQTRGRSCVIFFYKGQKACVICIYFWEGKTGKRKR